MPYNLILIMVLLLCFRVKPPRLRRQAAFVFAALYGLANTYLVTKAFNFWEIPPRPVSSVSRRYETGILLTGGLTAPRSSRQDIPQLGVNADRVSAAFFLYKSGVCKKLLITGTDRDILIQQGLGEGQQARRLLIAWGVPEADILLESEARNTYENAVFTARMLGERKSSERFLLITSAFHMRRALACFEKAGLAVDAFPADFRGTGVSYPLKKLLVPEPGNVGEFTLLWREWVGFAVYRLMGYC